jgi:hypothetical protein
MENHCLAAHSTEEPEIDFDFGTFEGFNFRSQSAIDRVLTASEVVAWDHDRLGEAEFWPAGDRPELSLVFRGATSVTGRELRELNRLLVELGGDDTENFLRIFYLLHTCGSTLEDLHREQVEDQCLHLFFGENFTDLRQQTAYELFELYYPEAYEAWEKHPCDGLIFDTDRFLDSPSWSIEEIELGERRALIVVSQ